MLEPIPDSKPGLTHHFDRRIVRYGLVGAIGIPINNAALAVFLFAMGGIYWISLLLAFEISTTVNYVLNQLYTYSDQKHLRGWDWPRRALKAQMSSASALALAIGIALVLRYGRHVQDFVATDVGIIIAFFYNFLLSRRLVFRPEGR
jgi:putative flippase GtrA